MNAHEARARGEKVAKLVNLVREAAPTMPVAELAEGLAVASDLLRAAIAKAAGVRAPSSLTWAWVVAAVREAA